MSDLVRGRPSPWRPCDAPPALNAGPRSSEKAPNSTSPQPQALPEAVHEQHPGALISKELRYSRTNAPCPTWHHGDFAGKSC